MLISDYTEQGLVRQWSLVKGVPICLEDALHPVHPSSTIALGRNEAIRCLLEATETYRKHLSTPKPNLNRMRQTITLEGYEYEPEPAWLEYDEIQAAIVATPSVTKALHVILHETPDEAAFLEAEAEVQIYVEAAIPILPSIPVPDKVTNYQARAALMQAGMFEIVNEWAKASGPTSSEFQAWEYANEFFRHGALLTSAAVAFGLTEAQLDDLFRMAVLVDD